MLPNGELVGRKKSDHVVASQRLQEKIKNMEVVEDFESRPHKAVTFLAERDKKIQDMRWLKVPQVLPGFGGIQPRGRSKAEGGNEEKEEIDEVLRVRRR